MQTRLVIYATNRAGGAEDGLEITRDAKGFLYEGKTIPVIPGVCLKIRGYWPKAEKSGYKKEIPARIVCFDVPREDFAELRSRLEARGWTQTAIASW